MSELECEGRGLERHSFFRGAAVRRGAATWAAALVVLLLGASPQNAFAGPPTDIPLTDVVINSEFAAIATVIARDGPKTCHRQLPHTSEKVTFRCSAYSAAIAEVLLDKGGRAPEGTVTIVARDLPPAPDLQVPRLETGMSYLFLLQRLPGAAGELFLPDYFKHYLPASPENLEALRTVISRLTGRRGNSRPIDPER